MFFQCSLLSVSLLLLATAVTSASQQAFQGCLSRHSNPPPALYPSSQSFSNVLSQSIRTNTGTPSIVVQPSSERHVKVAVRCAREGGFTVCPRSGGHDLEGMSRCSGVMVDLVNMQGVQLNKKNNVVVVGPAVMLGQMVYELYQQSTASDRRCVPVGVCPGVAVAGYILGGGHGPYSGLLGLTCDSLKAVRMVNQFGKTVVATRTKNVDLFKASCGGSGGINGIVTKFKLKTASCKQFDNAAIFRFQWSINVAGDLISKWFNYKQDGGKTWARLEINKNEGPVLYGMCWDVSSAAACQSRLSASDFFDVPSRNTIVLQKVPNVLHAQGFIGPAGGWARSPVSDAQGALTSYRYSEAGMANGRLYQSAAITIGGGNGVPSASYWQQYANWCHEAFSTGAAWSLCQWNPWVNAVTKGKNNYFPYRGISTLTELITAPVEDSKRKSARLTAHRHLKQYLTGIYVNYPEPEDELPGPYQNLYWGKFLPQLREVKNKYNPCDFFEKAQTIQSSPGACKS